MNPALIEADRSALETGYMLLGIMLALNVLAMLVEWIMPAHDDGQQFWVKVSAFFVILVAASLSVMEMRDFSQPLLVLQLSLSLAIWLYRHPLVLYGMGYDLPDERHPDRV